MTKKNIVDIVVTFYSVDRGWEPREDFKSEREISRLEELELRGLKDKDLIDAWVPAAPEYSRPISRIEIS